MRKLAFLAALIPALAGATVDTWYASTAVSPWGLSTTNPGATILWCQSDPDVNGGAGDACYACTPALTHDVTIAAAVVTMTGTINSSHLGTKTYTAGLFWYNGSAYTEICKASWGATGSASTWTKTCTPAATTIAAGNQLCYKVTVPSVTGTDSGGQEIGSISFTQTCGRVGGAACTGFCGGATCGTYSDSGLAATDACRASCTSCTAANVPVPTGLSCLDQNVGSATYCSWNAAAGASTYQLTRVGTGGYVYDGGDLSFTDYPGSGVKSYTIGAWGVCAPAIGGTSQNILGNASAPLEVQIRSKGIISGCW